MDKIMEKIKEFFKPENLKPFLKNNWPYCAVGCAALVALVVVLVVVVRWCRWCLVEVIPPPRWYMLGR